MTQDKILEKFSERELINLGMYYTELRKGYKDITVQDIYGPNNTAKDRLMGIEMHDGNLAEKINDLDENECKVLVKIAKEYYKDHKIESLFK
ncbi:MAG TPA: hypothetical protein VFV52_11765 [Bacilli bacterium]|nr:hypothetical protein [Bacilli bacterium]